MAEYNLNESLLPQRRRQFLKNSLTVATAIMLDVPAWAQHRRVERVGLQLYTLRKEMAEDFEGTLARVAQIGYREMEFAGYYQHSASEVRRVLDQNGLSSPAAHIQLAALRADFEAELAFANRVGQRVLVVPNLPANERSLDDFKRHAETLNRAGEVCKRAGIKIAYHNHDFEFKPTDNKLPYDILLEETDPGLVDMELDLYWITSAGQDPLRYFAAHPGRFSLLHVKDRGIDGNIVDVGRGVIDFAEIFSHADDAGVQHYFVEHDHPGDGLASIAYSINTIRNLQF